MILAAVSAIGATLTAYIHHQEVLRLQQIVKEDQERQHFIDTMRQLNEATKRAAEQDEKRKAVLLP